jgi:predicted phage tail protein
MRTVKLYGELGKKFGRIHRFAVKSPAEAIRALCVNFKGFEKYLLDSDQKNVGYKVFADSENIDESGLRNPVSEIIKFIPVVMGAGDSTGKIILGAVLVVAGAVLTYYSGGTLAAIGHGMISVGIAFIAGGVYQALSPQPKSPDPVESPNNKPSYSFSGAVNTSAQGQPVPLCYGRMIVGSAVISAGISIDDVSPPPPKPGTFSKTGGILVYTP